MPLRQVGAFALALALFLASLFAGRFMTTHPMPIHPASSPSPVGTPTPDVTTPSVTPTSTPSVTPSPPLPTPTVPATGTILLDDTNTTAYVLRQGCLVHPLRLLVRGDDLYVLDTGVLKQITLSAEPVCQPVLPPDNRVEEVVVQELGDIALSGDRDSILLLDRAGNVFRYSPEGSDWQVERLALAPEASSRQHLVSVSAYQGFFYLLDTNVGQIWRHSQDQAEVVAADLDLRGSIDLAVSDSVFILAQEGYRGPLRLHKLDGYPLTPDPDFAPPPDTKDPSLLSFGSNQSGQLYVIDMDHQRLRLLDEETGQWVREYLFASEGTEILAADAEGQTLYMASEHAIYVYPREPLAPAAPALGTPEAIDLASVPPHDSRVLELLPPMALPIEGTVLSDLSFRLPGAPRSYRYGVHEGIDFYWAAGQAVTSTTPVLSVADGQVIRIDSDYNPPPVEEMEAMLAHAEEAYHTPEDILDVLRGRQVWIKHASGLTSRYCHLSEVAQGLQVGDQVKQGQRIGYVGNTGTPASYYGQGLEMHLHLEIRIGDGYLGQYLSPIEVKRWLNRAFTGNA